jgi:hAT family C-terminal dimerisation region
MLTAADTRWCSYRDMAIRVEANLAQMKQIAADYENSVKPSVITLLYDENFHEEVNNFIAISDPVCKIVNTCQEKNCSIADSCQLWLELQLPVEYANELLRRKKMVLNKYCLAANVLHPKYNGQLLSSDQLDDVDDFFLEELSNDGLEDLADFKEKRGVFKTLFDRKLENPMTFWTMSMNKHPFLSKLAKRLLRIPASSAQLERLFSSYSFVHNNKRNRLTNRRSKKLVFLYHQKLLDNNHSEDYKFC